MIKSILITKDGKDLSIRTKEGFLTGETVIPVKDAKELILGIIGLLGVGDEYIVVLRKRRKV
jgi:hypothetical protein